MLPYARKIEINQEQTDIWHSHELQEFLIPRKLNCVLRYYLGAFVSKQK